MLRLGVLPTIVACGVLACSTAPAAASITAFSGVGATANTALQAFEAGIGGANNFATPPQQSGFRTINWDGVPSEFSDPNLLPADFFNLNSPRGMVLSTPGTGFEVSAGGFGSINATYPSNLSAFSPTRIFSPIGSNTTDVTFYLAGTTTPAAVRGFGAIFLDVEFPNTSGITYFDAEGHNLATLFAPTGSNAQAEFLGALFDPEKVAKVRIVSGTAALGPSEGAADIVALDDFAYAEPGALPPAPTTDPAEGAPVTAPGAQPECVVPKLKGKRLRAAKKALRNANCAVGKVARKKSTVRPGRVIKQRPKPKTTLPAGSKVTLTVSRP
jgi:hypothetical protein